MFTSSATFLRQPLFVLCLLAFACGRQSITQLERKHVRVTKENISIRNGNMATDSVQVQYLGCGGLIIRHSNKAILIDPFLSNQPFLKIGCAMYLGTKICIDKDQIAVGKNRILTNLYLGDSISFREEARAIFNAHGHYDHLMDIPYVHERWFNAQPEVYLSRSAYNAVKPVMDTTKISLIDEIISTRESIGDRIIVDGTSFVVYPIKAEHNPHTKKRKFFSGSVTSSPEGFEDPVDETSINNWLEGVTVSFLVDIKKGKEPVFRIFVQSSSANYPNGLPPQDLLEEKSVDLAIMGVASYKFSETTYPCDYINVLKPNKLMFIHWEDFFRKYGRAPKTVMKTRVPRFFNEVLAECTTDYILPVPGVVVTFKK